MRKIGVFDSGIGGLSVAQAIKKALPNDEIIYASDSVHVPYGDKSAEAVYGFVLPVLQGLIEQGCKVIVIACNTVTTNHIERLRKELSVPLVGIEPMVKPAAAQTKSGVIAVCATPATLQSERYAWLKRQYASDVMVVEPDCSQWAYMIEHNKLNEEKLRHQIDEVCKKGADVIVLGCTHYHWIEEEIKEMAAGRAAVMQPEEAVVAQLLRQIAQL